MIDILIYVVIGITVLIVVATGVFFLLHYRKQQKYEDWLFEKELDKLLTEDVQVEEVQEPEPIVEPEPEPEKPKPIVLNIHSTRHVVTSTPAMRVDTKAPVVEIPRKVLGMKKLTEAQRLRVIHHREREKKHGQKTE